MAELARVAGATDILVDADGFVRSAGAGPSPDGARIRVDDIAAACTFAASFASLEGAQVMDLCPGRRLRDAGPKVLPRLAHELSGAAGERLEQ
jgi:hypothetical protein